MLRLVDTQAISDLFDTFSSSVRVSDGELLSNLLFTFLKFLDDNSEYSRNLQLNDPNLKKLISAIGETRGLPMKVAQVVAFLDPRVPPELREALETLQTHGRAMSFKTVRELLEAEFHQNLEDLFMYFSKSPVAAASIGQVHQARLRDGTLVAVKVQYPEIRNKCEYNFREMEFIQALSRFIGGPSQTAQNLMRDIHETILLECDYEREAEMQHRYQQIFQEDPNISIPKVHFSHSRKHILTTDWADGSNWSCFRRSASQFERNRAAAAIARFYAQSAFTYKMFHVDPHPGNFIFSGSKVVIVDFGRVRMVSDERRDEFRRLHELILSRDKAHTEAFIHKASFFILGPKFDFDQFWTVLCDMSWHLQFNGDVIFSRELLLEQRRKLRDLAQTFSIQISPDFFWTMLFIHPLMLAGRADLGAAGNWRKSLETNM